MNLRHDVAGSIIHKRGYHAPTSRCHHPTWPQACIRLLPPKARLSFIQANPIPMHSKPPMLSWPRTRGIKVEWVRDGTPKIMAKLRAEIEAGNPQPDVLLISDVVTMEGLKKEGRLLPFKDADTKGIDPALIDKDGTYFSTKLITTGIVYNTKAPFVPTSWSDLTKPEAKNLVSMPSPLSSGAAMIHTVTLTGNLPQGWDYYAELAKNGAQAAGGNGDVLKAVSGGDKLYGMIVDYMPIREKAKGAPVEFVFPKEGVSAVTEPVAILSTAKNPEAAKAFVNFLLSEEGQKVAVEAGLYPGARRCRPAGRLSGPFHRSRS